MERETAFIGFGSNVGDRLDYCDRAVTLLGLLPNTRVIAVSSLYETEPVADAGNPGTGWFLNGVVRLETEMVPERLLAVCRDMEQALGRNQERREGPRTLDLDILFYGNRVIDRANLVIPHPRLHLRRFVLAPMAELDPDWRHPVFNRTVRELLAHLSDPAEVRRLDPQPSPRYGFRPACSARSSATP